MMATEPALPSSSDAEAWRAAAAVRPGLWPVVAAVAVLAALAALAAFVVATDAGMEYDDAVYLTRGFFHASQAQAKGNLVVPRLVWSLGFEAPKPPLFHALLAGAAMVFGKGHLSAVLVAGTLVPLLAVGVAIAAVAFAIHPRWWSAGFSLALYLAMPASLGLGTRLLTETTLAATVVGGAWFALRRSSGHGNALRAELGTGICAGLSLLAKLLGPLFLGPVVAVALVACWRREGWKPALRFAAIASAAAAVVALPWYLRNWQEAWGFALYARQQLSCLYPFPAWMRPIDFVRGSLGWPVAAVLLVLALRPAAGGDGTAALYRRMALCGAAVSAVVIGVQPMFDPRFWLPAAALLAPLAGARLAAVFGSGRPGWRFALVALAGALVANAGLALRSAPRARMAWQASAMLERIVPATTQPPVLCTLGNNPDWNVEKLRLAVELSGLRPRPVVSDLLVDGRAVDFERRLASCGVVFGLRPDQVPPVANQQGLNVDLADAWRRLEALDGNFAPAGAAAVSLGSRARVEVLVRRPHAPKS